MREEPVAFSVCRISSYTAMYYVVCTVESRTAESGVKSGVVLPGPRSLCVTCGMGARARALGAGRGAALLRRTPLMSCGILINERRFLGAKRMAIGPPS